MNKSFTKHAFRSVISFKHASMRISVIVHAGIRHVWYFYGYIKIVIDFSFLLFINANCRLVQY